MEAIAPYIIPAIICVIILILALCFIGWLYIANSAEVAQRKRMNRAYRNRSDS